MVEDIIEDPELVGDATLFFSYKKLVHKKP